MSTSLLNSRSSFCPPTLSLPLSLPLSQIKSYLNDDGDGVRRPRNLIRAFPSVALKRLIHHSPHNRLGFAVLSLSPSLSLSLSLSSHLAASPPQWRCRQSNSQRLIISFIFFFSLSFSLFLSFFPQELPTSRNAHLLLIRYVPCRKARVTSARGLSFGEYFSPVEKPILENGLSRRFHQQGKF